MEGCTVRGKPIGPHIHPEELVVMVHGYMVYRSPDCDVRPIDGSYGVLKFLSGPNLVTQVTPPSSEVGRVTSSSPYSATMAFRLIRE